MASYTKSDILNMTVAEFISKTHFKVKLGAKDGSAFVFCGYVGDMDIEQLDTAIVTGYEASLHSAQTSIKGITEQEKDFESFKTKHKRLCSKAIAKIEESKSPNSDKELLIAEAKEKFDHSKQAHSEWLTEQNRKLRIHTETAKRIEARLKKYTSIGDRKIVYMKPSQDEEETYIVLYEGRENGSWWTTHEYESGEIDYGRE